VVHVLLPAPADGKFPLQPVGIQLDLEPVGPVFPDLDLHQGASLVQRLALGCELTQPLRVRHVRSRARFRRSSRPLTSDRRVWPAPRRSSTCPSGTSCPASSMRAARMGSRRAWRAARMLRRGRVFLNAEGQCRER
jgi:hypothetical protein